MRIEPNRPVKAAASRRDEKAGAAGVSSFAELLGGEKAAAAQAAAPAAGITSLLALQELQELPDATTGRRRAIERGETLLDGLDELRLGLLTGTIGRDKLAHLARAVRSARVTCDDPRLQDVLDDIELRAEVELAKLSVALA
jgi:hypothetical protein